MRNFFWISGIIILSLAAGIFAMPQNWKEKIPVEKVKNYTLSKKIHFGTDLAGGRKIDFLVDLSRVHEKINAGEKISESDVVAGVQSTLQRRIDPDGTRELRIYPENFGNEKHIMVELTSDLDTPDTLKKLQKKIDLEFKTEKQNLSESEKEKAKNIAEEYLQQLTLENFVEIGEKISDPEFIKQEENTEKFEGMYISFSKDQKKFADEIDAETKEKIWDAKTNTIFPEVVTGGNEYFGNFSIFKIQKKELATREKTYPPEDFFVVADEISEVEKPETPEISATEENEETDPNAPTLEAKISTDWIHEKKNSELPEEIQEKIKELPENEVSEILENFPENKFSIIKKLKTEEGQEEKIAVIFNTDRAKIETARKRVMEKKEEIEEEQLTFDKIDFLVISSPWEKTGLDGSNFRIAKVAADQTGLPVVSIEFDDEGAKKFEDLTANNIGKRIAIFVGGVMISSPKVNKKISGGAAQISFGGDEENTNIFDIKKQAISLAQDLNAGAIPAPIILLGNDPVPATVGQNALNFSITAGKIGLLFLAIWLIFSYRLLGIFAVFSLSIYIILLIFVLKFFPNFVLTLASVAGILLSIGMAVDANILIFERMKEELRNGNNFSTALSVGFERAWNSIRDSNLSTLLTCAILYIFGTSIVRGFATMLAIGVLFSMFTAIFITKKFLKVLVGTKISRNKVLI